MSIGGDTAPPYGHAQRLGDLTQPHADCRLATALITSWIAAAFQSRQRCEASRERLQQRQRLGGQMLARRPCRRKRSKSRKKNTLFCAISLRVRGALALRVGDSLEQALIVAATRRRARRNCAARPAASVLAGARIMCCWLSHSELFGIEGRGRLVHVLDVEGGDHLLDA